MLYQSTRGDNRKVSGAEAIAQGLAGDGGLFVPQSFPRLGPEDIKKLITEPYYKRAAHVIGLFLEDFNSSELISYSKAAYNTSGGSGFDSDKVAPLKKIDEHTHFLELWHGPTCAFKDMALQIMPRLLSAALHKTNEVREVCVLVATSGDTGKAALEGFKNIAGTKIMVFYPDEGVSEVQKLQMTSQSGDNVNVTAIKGNFDDAQTGVKAIFSDADFCNELEKTGYILSSANSINWGRLVPQITYYISAYCDLIKIGEIEMGDKINFCVPTGNFGNILSAYYAEKMGLPINKLICASNRNDVLTQFIDTGVYDKNRPFYATVSPSMDILVSSNLERLLFELSGRNGEIVSTYMKSLASEGIYTVPEGVRNELSRVFSSGFCSEEDTMKTIKETLKKSDYLIDTHTAVAYKVLNDYVTKTNDKSISVVVSTASPFKFCEAVLDALGQPQPNSGTALIEKLSELTGCAVPIPLRALKNAVPRFKDSVAVSEMKASVLNFIKGR
jgi:threonine synthase